MTTQNGLIFRTRAYKDCAVQAASYHDSGDWFPEACVWRYTDTGWRRLWIRSFEHLFARRDVTFTSRNQADDYAFRLAQMLIDKTLTEEQKPVSGSTLSFSLHLPKILRRDWRQLALYKVIKQLKNRD